MSLRGANGIRLNQLRITAKDDVGAAACHVCSHGHGIRHSGLGNNLRLALVPTRMSVKDLMSDSTFLEDVGNDLRLLNSGGTYQYWATVVIEGFDLVRQRTPLRVLSHVDEVLMVNASVFAVRRYRRDL